MVTSFSAAQMFCTQHCMSKLVSFFFLLSGCFLCKNSGKVWSILIFFNGEIVTSISSAHILLQDHIGKKNTTKTATQTCVLSLQLLCSFLCFFLDITRKWCWGVNVVRSYLCALMWCSNTLPLKCMQPLIVFSKPFVNIALISIALGNICLNMLTLFHVSFFNYCTLLDSVTVEKVISTKQQQTCCTVVKIALILIAL